MEFSCGMQEGEDIGQILPEGMSQIFSITCIALIFNWIVDPRHPNEIFDEKKLDVLTNDAKKILVF